MHVTSLAFKDSLDYYHYKEYKYCMLKFNSKHLLSNEFEEDVLKYHLEKLVESRQPYIQKHSKK
jgi:hypothetical protein